MYLCTAYLWEPPTPTFPFVIYCQLFTFLLLPNIDSRTHNSDDHDDGDGDNGDGDGDGGTVTELNEITSSLPDGGQNSSDTTH